jgi:hypothetical protein
VTVGEVHVFHAAAKIDVIHAGQVHFRVVLLDAAAKLMVYVQANILLCTLIHTQREEMIELA